MLRRAGARSPRSSAMLLEVVVIRRLADAPRLVLLMATIGIAQLLGFAVLVFAELLPDVPPGGDFPTLVPQDWSWQVTKDLLIGREISVLIAVPILVVAARAVHDPHPPRADGPCRGVELRDKSRLWASRWRARRRWSGASPPRSPRSRSSCSRPVQFVTPPGAATGPRSSRSATRAGQGAVGRDDRPHAHPLVTIPVGIALGIVEVIFQQNVTGIDRERLRALAVRRDARRRARASSRRRVATDDGGSWKLAVAAPAPRPRKPRATPGGCDTSGTPGSSCVALLVLVLIPFFAPRRRSRSSGRGVVIFAIAGCSLTILTGWAGQLSLGQFGFSAIGGLVTVKMVDVDGWFGMHHVPWGVAVDPRRARRRGGRGAHRPPCAPHPGPVPRGHDARVRGVRGELAGDPPVARRRRAHRDRCPVL